ncbi:MAG: molybdopterin molybdotransferase MoeA [Chloroflexia bacterium]|nr:molybdopterin molybdotransferase MoeA [Chloroflexia bacterium]
MMAPEPKTPLAQRPWENVERMVDVDAALDRVLAQFCPLDAEELSLLDAVGRILARNVVARDDVPPFRNSAMDGYAVMSADIAAATWNTPVSLPIVAQIAAGHRTIPRLKPGQAIRIMTGAPMPTGADAVVRFEETDESHAPLVQPRKTVRISRAAAPQDNVREAGEDIARGALIACPGAELTPALLGIIAAAGEAHVAVYRRPVVGILSTGNEVVAAGCELEQGMIRDSNSVVIGALARQWGADARLLGIARDSVPELSARLSDARDVDLLVTSGGVSLGDYDFVKDVLHASGSVAIWQVRMKPGKPLAFGSIDGTPLIGLPGNPVAAAVSFFLFGRPVVRKLLGHRELAPRTVDVLTTEAIDNRGQRRHYARVLLQPQDDGPALATVVGSQGAGILSSFAGADALLVVPEHLERVEAGTRLRALLLDQ